jgi:hypothetical protein
MPIAAMGLRHPVSAIGLLFEDCFMSELSRVVRKILSAMRAKPAVPMRDYEVEAAILAHAERSSHKPIDERDSMYHWPDN